MFQKNSSLYMRSHRLFFTLENIGWQFAVYLCYNEKNLNIGRLELMRNLIVKIMIMSVLCLMLSLTTVYAEETITSEITNEFTEDTIDSEVIPNEIELENTLENDVTTEIAVEPKAPVHPYFYDIPEEHYAYEAIDRLYTIGATNYRVENKFMPDAAISRAELVQMIVSAKGIAPVDPVYYPFTDVDSTNAYAPYIDIAHRFGIVDGKGNNQFRPGDPVRRDELIKMLVTATGELEVMWTIDWRERTNLLAPFTDMKQASANSWSTHYIAYALKNNIIGGYPDNTIRADQYTTRAEAAILIDRVLLNSSSKVMAASLQQVATDATDSSIPYVKKLDMTATKYSSKEANLSTHTHSGLTTRVGTVAIDRSIIPFGTHLYIEGYGYAVAADTGGAIKGNKIDLYSDSLQEALKFGIQPVTVYVLP